MSTCYEPTLLAFAEQIADRGFRDWIVAHTSFLKPLHRYEGALELDGSTLRYEGRGRRDGERLKLEIAADQIRDVHYGFDDCFRRGEDRQLGLLGFMPLRIRYRQPGHRERTIYLFARFRRGLLGRRCSNEELEGKLRQAS